MVSRASRSEGRPATIYDVARQASVSHQSVALYLRGHTGFRAATRERIEQALLELQYRPNLEARSLATSTSHRIGALVSALGEEGPNRTVQGATVRAREAGYVLDLVPVDPADPSAVSTALGVLGQQSLAGVLAFAPIDLLAEQIERVPFSVPLLLETEAQQDSESEVGLNRPGLILLVDHLVDLGHRRFFHLAGPSRWLAARNRQQAYDEALARHGLVSLGSLEGNWSAASGYDAALRMPRDLGVTAVVAADDQMALGALLAFDELGLDVPGDLSITGFDDLPEARFYRPPLTTVRVDYAMQGRLLMERMLALLGGTVVPRSRFDSPRLQVRRSTAPPSRT